ncbi:MarR family transcriptional regulator [Streptomyces sp. RKAG290]|uniref:MarR family transcriptional regulator n=1 Tax=Streptomyces sp. RKAG290 TaxID=2888348 RepID=UPI0020349FC2|nr:MarR family transcriptional regulator [Streptomyces sp. RKAG290]MCM2412139.1 MarR family transcriptional regulator [Streptomyces sp. RKAG290]
MATQNLSSALCAPEGSPPYARANPGYGKRTAPHQAPPRPDDFSLLPERERFIAGYVDKLPDGAAMDIKSLAKNLPLYGQMAVASALRALGVAGYLRHVRCPAASGDQVRWVTRTYWSRSARDNEWWNAFLSAAEHPPAPSDVVADAPPPPPWVPTETPAAALPASPLPAQATSVPPQRAPEQHSPAYLTLARLGRDDPRLALSAADCTTLEEHAAAWLDRGVNTEYLTQALTAGLPERVDSPVGFLRRRLRDKMPPQLPTARTPETSPRRLLVECTECGTPGRPEALPDGLCQDCRTPTRTPEATAAIPERNIHALVGNLRDLLKTP